MLFKIQQTKGKFYISPPSGIPFHLNRYCLLRLSPNTATKVHSVSYRGVLLET